MAHPVHRTLTCWLAVIDLNPRQLGPDSSAPISDMRLLDPMINDTTVCCSNAQYRVSWVELASNVGKTLVGASLG